MKSIFLKIVLLFFFSIECLSQNINNKNLYIEDKDIKYKSSNTYFVNRLYLYRINKYIKLKILVNFDIKKDFLDSLKINIFDSTNKKILFGTYSTGNLDIGYDKNIKYSKCKAPRYPHNRLIIKRGKIIMVKFPMRFKVKTKAFFELMGYKLAKGIYNLNVRYSDGSIYYLSNSIKLIIY